MTNNPAADPANHGRRLPRVASDGGGLKLNVFSAALYLQQKQHNVSRTAVDAS